MKGGAQAGAKGGAKIFLKEVEDATRFGVATLVGETVVEIEEKPKSPKTNLAVTGLFTSMTRTYLVSSKH